MNREPNPFVAPDFSWADEEDACRLYLKEYVFLDEATDKRSTFLEQAAACLFEYTREIFLQITNEEESCRRWLFLDRWPFALIGQEWEIRKGESFPKRPWTKLSKKKHKRIAAGLRDGYAEPPRIAVDLAKHNLRGTFDKFKKKAECLVEEAMKTEFPDNYESAWEPCIPAEELGSGAENVIFTIDYREGRERLLRAFGNWLDSRKELLAQYKQLDGVFYRKRLKDLAYFRLWREYGEEPAGFSIPGFASSRSETRARVREFIDCLQRVTFQNIRDLVRDIDGIKPPRTKPD